MTATRNQPGWLVMEEEEGGGVGSGWGERWWISHNEPVTYIFSAWLTWQGVSRGDS